MAELELQAVNTADAPDTNLRWSTVTQSGEAPTKRYGHSLNIVGNNAFLFAGCDARRPPGPNSDVYVLRVSNSGASACVPVALVGSAAPAGRGAAREDTPG